MGEESTKERTVMYAPIKRAMHEFHRRGLLADVDQHLGERAHEQLLVLYGQDHLSGVAESTILADHHGLPAYVYFELNAEEQAVYGERGVREMATVAGRSLFGDVSSRFTNPFNFLNQRFRELVQTTFPGEHRPQDLLVEQIDAARGRYMVTLDTSFLLSAEPTQEEIEGHIVFFRKNKDLLPPALERITGLTYQARVDVHSYSHGTLFFSPSR